MRGCWQASLGAQADVLGFKGVVFSLEGRDPARFLPFVVDVRVWSVTIYNLVTACYLLRIKVAHEARANSCSHD
jgi:hypothetical protein